MARRRRRQPRQNARPQPSNPQPVHQQSHNCHRCGMSFPSRNHLMRHVHSRSCQRPASQGLQPVSRPHRNRQNQHRRGQSQNLTRNVTNTIANALARHSAVSVMNAVNDAFARNSSHPQPPNTHHLQGRTTLVGNLTINNTTVIYQAPGRIPLVHSSATATPYPNGHHGPGFLSMVRGAPRGQLGWTAETRRPRLQECESSGDDGSASASVVPSCESEAEDGEEYDSDDDTLW
jgi:hypothetical protein